MQLLVKHLFIIIVLLTISVSSTAQSIKRKGGLGIAYYQNLPDSLSQKIGYKKGAVVQYSLPGTTADKIGIKPNDIITRINKHIINAPSQISAIAKQLREDDVIDVLVVRGGKEITLHGEVVPKPKETSEIAEVIYGSFKYKNGLVRTIYKTLKGKKPVGTIYFLQGLPCYSMDNFSKLDMTKQALDAMVDRGFAVYRMEKGDMGDNVNTTPCEELGFFEELDMHDVGYQNLLTLKDVDTAKIFLFGHSMGGITAPFLSAKYQPKGVVVYGTVFKPWMDYLLDAYYMQPLYYGKDLAMLREKLEIYKPYIYKYFYNNIPLEEITKDPIGLEALKEIVEYNDKTKLAASGRNMLCHKELNKANVTRAWRNTYSSVLAIYGECDINAINANDHKDLVSYINTFNPGKASFWQAPGTTHTFEEIGSMETFIKMQANPQNYYQYSQTKFNSKVFDYVCNWFKKL